MVVCVLIFLQAGFSPDIRPNACQVTGSMALNASVTVPSFYRIFAFKRYSTTVTTLLNVVCCAINK